LSTMARYQNRQFLNWLAFCARVVVKQFPSGHADGPMQPWTIHQLCKLSVPSLLNVAWTMKPLGTFTGKVPCTSGSPIKPTVQLQYYRTQVYCPH
jgi:hypothetical protein